MSSLLNRFSFFNPLLQQNLHFVDEGNLVDKKGKGKTWLVIITSWPTKGLVG